MIMTAMIRMMIKSIHIDDDDDEEDNNDRDFKCRLAAGFVVTAMLALAARTAVELLVCHHRNHHQHHHCHHNHHHHRHLHLCHCYCVKVSANAGGGNLLASDAFLR